MAKLKKLIKDIEDVKKSKTKKVIDLRLKEFESFKDRSNKEWFSELCFCILTANSKAKSAISIQNELKVKGFCTFCADDVKKCIMKNKHRFHNNKTNYIMLARKYMDIKDKMLSFSDEFLAREWIVSNIKGLGIKEASHFLRNVGYKNLAIVDRHIINILYENKIISEKPKTVTKKVYRYIEHKLSSIGKRVNMDQAKLDLYLWYLKTGEVLK